MKEKILICSLLVGSAILASCHKKEKATVHSPYRVEVVAVDTTQVASSRVYSGTIEESSGVDLSFPVPGTIATLSVDAGDRVTRGQAIATIDASSLRNAHQVAQSALNVAQDTYNRMKKLHDTNSISDMKWVEVENALKAAQSSEAIARRSLADAVIHAPFSGYISQKYAEAGSNTGPGLPVVKLVRIDPIKAVISVPENEIGAIAIGQQAQVSGESLPAGAIYSGKVTERGVSADPITRAYSVSIEIANDGAQLLPGMICDVTLSKSSPESEIIIPNTAVLLDARNENYVWVTRGGKAYKQMVTVGGMTDNGIIIDSGLASGDTVIVHGQQKVSQGSPIEIINH